MENIGVNTISTKKVCIIVILVKNYTVKIFNTIVSLLAVALLFTTASCKKDKQLNCSMKSLSVSGHTTLYEFDASGYETKRTDSTTGTYNISTASGSLLTKQNYNAAGVATGSPKYFVINPEGLILQEINIDTTFLTYNSEGQMTKSTTGSGANITGWTIYTWADENVTSTVTYDGAGSITHTTSIDYYTDKTNKGNINFIYRFITDARYGKTTKNLIKQVGNSDGTSVSITNVTYTFDSDGYLTNFSLLQQPANTLMSADLSYGCNN